jgi:hypothetical protein
MPQCSACGSAVAITRAVIAPLYQLVPTCYGRHTEERDARDGEGWPYHWAAKTERVCEPPSVYRQDSRESPWLRIHWHTRTTCSSAMRLGRRPNGSPMRHLRQDQPRRSLHPIRERAAGMWGLSWLWLRKRPRYPDLPVLRLPDGPRRQLRIPQRSSLRALRRGIAVKPS